MGTFVQTIRPNPNRNIASQDYARASLSRNLCSKVGLCPGGVLSGWGFVRAPFPPLKFSEILQGFLFDHYPSETTKKMGGLCANFWDIMPNARKYRRKWFKMTKNRFLGMFAPLNFLKICRDVHLIIIFQGPSRKLRIHVLLSRNKVTRKEIPTKMVQKWQKVDFGHVPTIGIFWNLQGCLIGRFMC